MEEDNRVEGMCAIYGDTVREIVRQVNRLGITKDSIVALVKDGGQFILTYYA